MTIARRGQRAARHVAVTGSAQGGIGVPPAVSGLVSTALAEDPTPTLANPERGFFYYTETHYRADNSGFSPLTSAELSSQRITNGHSLAYRHNYLDKFMTTDTIDAAYLALIAADFAACRAAGVKMIIRFSYSDNPNNSNFIPPYNADPPLARVLQHIQQLSTVLNANGDVLYGVQAGFIGYWGEWYYTDNFCSTPSQPWILSASDWDKRSQVVHALLDGTASTNCWLFIRNPGTKERLFGQNSTDPKAARVGFHNDAFLASGDDWGTYTTFTTMSEAQTKEYVATETLHVPNGGESANPNSPRSDWTQADSDMARYHFSYLNPLYHPSVISSWGSSVDHARRKLGYRFVGTELRTRASVSAGSLLRVELDLRNDGYAAAQKSRAITFVLDDGNGHRSNFVLPASDIRQLQPGSYTFWSDMPVPTVAGTYTIGLWLPDSQLPSRAEYAIRLANTRPWNASQGYTELGTVIVV